MNELFTGRPVPMATGALRLIGAALETFVSIFAGHAPAPASPAAKAPPAVARITLRVQTPSRGEK